MKDRIDDDVLQWYQQFTHEPSEARDHSTPNFFIRANDNEISDFKKEFEGIIPVSYLEFLEKIGEGRLTLGENGNQSNEYENIFLNVAEIKEIITKSSNHWNVYEEFIGHNEIPFFYIGDNAVLVFRKGEGSKVYFPHLDDVYAESFGEFLKKLMKNVNFYNDI